MTDAKQPEVNIGMVGHVDHGKTTLTKTLSGIWTDKHSEEIKRGISIKLGYADAHFFKCPDCEAPGCYGVNDTCKACGTTCEFLRTISIVDAPGHETLMATMLSGAALMDGAILLIAANEECPQPQTREHLMALDIVGIKKLIIVQNKIDLVDEEKATENFNQIKEFVKGTSAENAPVIPVCAHHDANVDMLIKTIEDVVPTPDHDGSLPMRMFIARSFDVNLPGEGPDKLRGGILGGSLIQGILSVGEEIEISPGTKEKDEWAPIATVARSLIAGGGEIDKVIPGGLVGIGTDLDPAITKSDSMLGKVVGKPGTLPPVWEDMTMDINLLERVVGLEKEEKVERIRSNEPLMLNIGAATTVGLVKSERENICDVSLKLPVCFDETQRIAVSRRIGGRWRLIGYATAKR
jgi:translation initiation factor 2 subunit 3